MEKEVHIELLIAIQFHTPMDIKDIDQQENGSCFIVNKSMIDKTMKQVNPLKISCRLSD